jgi:hypothetical protein
MPSRSLDCHLQRATPAGIRLIAVWLVDSVTVMLAIRYARPAGAFLPRPECGCARRADR